jgi:predicted ArsR family transcriptional regulator
VRADIGNTGVVKSFEPDGRTREAVARLLMEQGPITAAAVAASLELSAPAVRRHLDALLADGEAETRAASRRGPRGRGRPAREYLLTDAGRARFGHGYDDLAVAALRYLAEHGGQSAVADFAQGRVEEMLGDGAAKVSAAHGADARAGVLADVLTARGYAAQTREAGSGVQLCQHHCPVAHVAAEFPQLCEAETHAFAELLGTHVQRLSTIARGNSACTTYVPPPAPDHQLLTTHVPAVAPDTRRSATTTIPRGRQSE